MTALMARRPWLVDVAIAVALSVAQALLVLPLFAGPLTRWRASIEGAFIADARFIVEHFPDLSWNPQWYLGFPFELFYTPLLQTAVALLGWLSGDVAGAYRVVAATGFVLGAAGLYTLARALGLARPAAVLATAIFVCAPSAALLLPGLWADAAGFTGSVVPLPWRLAVLVEYGEGPHVLGLSLALFATAAVLAYLRRHGAVRFWVAALLLLAVALTNLIALLGAAVFALGASFAVAGDPGRERRAIGLGATVAVLSLVWYSPGFVRAVGGFSTPGEGAASGYLFFPLFVAAAVLAARILGRRRPDASVLLFAGAVFTAILVAWYVWRTPIAPQPIRYALELDATVAIAVAALVARGLAAVRHMPRRSLAPAALAALVALTSLPAWAAVQSSIAPDPGWERWSEREVALWLRDRLGPGERAYLSGSHAFWASAFADVPQVRGGVDFAGLDPWWAHATYQINTGSDPQVSALWLRALGVRYAVVTGPGSTDAFRDFAKPDMFEGLLPLAATIQGARVYEVAAPRAAPTVVARHTPLAAPRDALDRAALEAYVTALDAGVPGARADFRPTRLGGWEGLVEPPAGGATVLFRTAYDEGWRAYLNGLPAPLRADALGMLALDLPGPMQVRVEHRVHGDLLLSNAAAFAFLAALAGRRVWRSRAFARAAPLAAIVALVALYALALGVVTGYPKGTDAPMHLARLKFVADWFPNHNWLYAWAAGMPAFDSYPGLPYVASLPLVRTIGPELTLKLLALLGFWALGLGLYGHLVERGRPRAVALTAALMAATSLALWAWIVSGGVYARIIAVGLGALAWWAHARALRLGHQRWWALTVLLLAAAISSHQVMGALASLYVAAVHLSARGWRGMPRLAALAGLTFLVAAPALLPAIADNGAGRFLGDTRNNLLASSPDTLWHPVHVGLAAFVVPVALVILELARRPWRALAAAVALAGVALYVFAPNLGIPTALYYVKGIDPFTMTFALAIVGALAFAALAPAPVARRGRVLLGLAVILVALNVVVAVPAFAAQRGYPRIADTTNAEWPEQAARQTLVVDGEDLRHRILPLTAWESVWFSYAYRKPMLRDYYATGIVHPDWIAWAFAGVYTPPLSAARVAAVTDWFALDAITTTPETGEAELAALPGLRLVPSTAASQFHQYTVEGPSAIVARTEAPIVVVVADARTWDLAARFFFDEGASPRTRVPVWWSGRLGELPDDLVRNAAAVLLVGDRQGDPAKATSVIDRLADRGVRIVWDVAGLDATEVPSPWPVTTLQAQPISAWDVRDAAGRIAGADFSPARYGDGPWGAPVPSALRDGARTELALAGAPLIASLDRGAGTLTVVGGNLFYHALANGNARERSYLASFLGPAARDAASEPAWRFVHPQRREIESDGAPIVLKESFHPGWSASWRAADGSTRALPVRYAGPGLMLVLPPGPGTVSFDYGPSSVHVLAWLLFLAGIAGLVLVGRGGLHVRIRP